MSKKLVKIIFAVSLTVLIITNLSAAMPVAFADESGDSSSAGEAGFTVLKENDTGDAVLLLQLRLLDLGYFNYKITNFFGEYTKKALAEFQKVNNLSADGVLGEETYRLLYSNAAKRRPVKEVVKEQPKSSSSSSMPKAHLRNWFGYVDKIFTRGETAKVYDVDTGITYNVTMVGGHNHADVEPTTADDTRKLLETYGGEWSWERRAVIVKIDGEWIAGSTNGQPHGYETVKGNNMDGQVCIHFLKSKTHGTSIVDSEHQSMVQKAYDKSN